MADATSGDTDPRRADAVNGILQRSTPFVFAIALGLALLPIQQTPINPLLLAFAVGAIAAVVALGVAVARSASMPAWTLRVLPYLFLLSVVLLRAATGGPRSGYVALMYLAPFWVALSDTRRQVVYVTIAMFAAQVAQGVAVGDLPAGLVVRGALLTTVVIGMMSLAVQASVSEQRLGRIRLRREADARARANIELAATNAALERSNKDLEQFAYVSSHDLQEPLRMIRSFSQMFMQRHGEQLDDDGRELLGFVLDGAERAQLLVADLLDYSRVGTEDHSAERVALDDVLDRAIEVLAPQVERSGATVVHDPGLPTVVGVPSQVERVLVNIVGNAIKYRAPDRAPEVRITAQRSGSLVRVEVADNGIGFDEEHTTRIFQMFQRLHPRGEYDGTGIGLAICARIVERHGGTISAHGRPGEGSTFTFTLEAAE